MCDNVWQQLMNMAMIIIYPPCCRGSLPLCIHNLWANKWQSTILSKLLMHYKLTYRSIMFNSRPSTFSSWLSHTLCLQNRCEFTTCCWKDCPLQGLMGIIPLHNSPDWSKWLQVYSPGQPDWAECVFVPAYIMWLVWVLSYCSIMFVTVWYLPSLP